MTPVCRGGTLPRIASGVQDPWFLLARRNATRYGYAATSDGNGMRIGQANQLAVRPATRSSPVGYEYIPRAARSKEAPKGTFNRSKLFSN